MICNHCGIPGFKRRDSGMCPGCENALDALEMVECDICNHHTKPDELEECSNAKCKRLVCPDCAEELGEYWAQTGRCQVCAKTAREREEDRKASLAYELRHSG